MCTSAQFGDYYSVGVLLRVTLAEELCMSGTLTALDMYMVIIDDFWVWTTGSKPKYAVMPTLAHYTDEGAPLRSNWT